MGSQLFTKEILAEQNWGLLKSTISEALAVAKKLTNS
jgi:hypothetical protein